MLNVHTADVNDLLLNLLDQVLVTITGLVVGTHYGCWRRCWCCHILLLRCQPRLQPTAVMSAAVGALLEPRLRKQRPILDQPSKLPPLLEVRVSMQPGRGTGHPHTPADPADDVASAKDG